MRRQHRIEARHHRARPLSQPGERRPLHEPEPRYAFEVLRLAVWLAWIIWQSTR